MTAPAAISATSRPAADSRTDLVGLDLADLTALFADLGEPAFRARQL